MDTTQLLFAIDSEIATLQQVRALLAGHPQHGRKPGRKKRRISAAGRARIAAAQKARWAKLKKAVKKTA